MTSDFHELDDADIKEFLENAPLYSWRVFNKPRDNRSSLWIREIDEYCDICDKIRPFIDMRARGGGAGMPSPRPLTSGTASFEFNCVSCHKSSQLYYVEHVVEGEKIRIQKFGELPRKKLNRNRDLQKFLKDDLDIYEKGMVCLTHEYGIAAFAYFRRIVENNIYRLLGLLKDELQSVHVDGEALKALDELREDMPMSKKIEIANIALPPDLKPDGLNPLGRLYGVLSAGVHNLSENDCLEKAKVTSECLAYLISELNSRRLRRDRFKSMVGDL